MSESTKLILNKATSVRAILAIFAGFIFMVVSISGALDMATVATIVTSVFHFYFQKDRGSK